MTTERFTYDELATVSAFPIFDRLGIALRSVGYTGVNFSALPGREVDVTVAETVNHGTLLAALGSSLNQLTVDTLDLVVSADGVSTGTIAVSGPEGAVVDACWKGLLYVDAGSKTISSGTAVFTFGPCPAGLRSKEIPIQFCCNGLEALSVDATVQFD